MTRINMGIDPRELCDQHLIAEYRELPRVRSVLTKRLEHFQRREDVLKGQPEQFTLGKGHVLWFLDKGELLHSRWHRLKNEMRRRGFSPSLQWRSWPAGYRYGYSWSSREARQLTQDRIRQRLPKNARWTNATRPGWTDG